MPKKFSTQEEQAIRASLKQAASRLMGSQGIKRTSVDSLCQAAGIAKGSFYRFYPSKEQLAMELFHEWEKEVHEALLPHLEAGSVEQLAQGMARVFTHEFPRITREKGLSGMLAPEEMQHLLRVLKPDQAQMMLEQDQRFIRRLSQVWQARGLRLRVSQDEAVLIFRWLFELSLTLPGTAPDMRSSREPQIGDGPRINPGGLAGVSIPPGKDPQDLTEQALQVLIRGTIQEMFYDGN